MELRQVDVTEWDDALPSSGFEPFHTATGLSLLDEYAPGDLQLYGGFKGEQAIGLFPAFVNERAVGRTVVSPPLSMAVPRLGPIVTPNSPKQRKQEQVTTRFTEAVLEALEVDSQRTLVHLLLSTTQPDPRPYIWNGLTVAPEFTYLLDVEGRTLDDLLAGFSRDLRKDINRGADLDVSVDVEGVDAARVVYDDVAERYREQGESLGVPWPFVRDVVTSFDERCRVYVARDGDDEFRNGMIFLYSNDAVYSWFGGTRDTVDSVSTKSLVQWRMLTDLVEEPPIESVTRYDLSGANTERLCRYKSAFGGSLAPYYRVESGGATMKLAKRAYQAVKG